MMKKRIQWIMASTALFGLLFFSAQTATRAQSLPRWSSFENISKTATASTYPSIAADRFGQVHVVWSEDVGGETENLFFNTDGTPIVGFNGKQVNNLEERGNTIFYSLWKDENWSNPVDILTSLDGHLTFPELAIDSKGTVHLIYTESFFERTDLMYSRSPGDVPTSVQSWTEPVILASKLIAYDHPIGITVDSLDGLHVLYFIAGASPGVYVTSSYDGGDSWSSPLLLFGTSDVAGNEDGCQPVRISSDPKGRVHAMWTRYGSDGNGKEIYYSQSLDQGKAWSDPFLVAAWQPGWYEVDWLNAGVIGDEIHLVWEGGPVAYANERISQDGGKSWGTEQRIMPKLEGENGFNDLVADSQGTLHQANVRRIQAGTMIISALWYNQYQDKRWTTPVVIGLADENFYNNPNDLSPGAVNTLFSGSIMGSGIRYQRMAILNGNEIFVLIVNEYDGEIYATRSVANAPRISPESFPTADPLPTSETNVTALPIRELQPTASFDKSPDGPTSNPGTLVMASLIPVIILVLSLFFFTKIAQNKH